MCIRDRNISPPFKEQNFKDALLANLFSTVELLKNEISEKNEVIRKLMSLIPDTNTCRNADVETSHLTLTNMHSRDSSSCYSQERYHNSEINSSTHFNKADSLAVIYDIYEPFGDSLNEEDFDDEQIISNENVNDNSSHSLEYNAYLQAIDIGSIVNENGHSMNLTTISGNKNERSNINTHKWPHNTCLIAGDSIINNLDELKLSKGGVKVKVRAFSGSNIYDMYEYISPLLRKEPDYIILHIGTADAPNKSADDILIELLQLKNFIANKLPHCRIIISQPTVRNDIPCARLVIRTQINKLNNLTLEMVDNSNIEFEQLGKKGLHLNKWGTSKLAMNYISLIREFQH